MIKHIAFTTYPVRDMKRAREFYEKDLGLSAGKELAGGKWVEYYLGDNCFAITSIAPERFTPRDDGAGIAFEVDNVDVVFKSLQKKGVKVKMPPTDSPICRMAMVVDPEGNFVTFHQKKT